MLTGVGVCGGVDVFLTTDAPEAVIMSSLVELAVTIGVVTILAARQRDGDPVVRRHGDQ